ncbi:hypothetical protein [Bacteroides helcogenes]|nr:hypothetical protein [Bacteroides helcogenes]
MIEETLRTEFEALKNDFEIIRQQIESDVIRTELYKGSLPHIPISVMVSDKENL